VRARWDIHPLAPVVVCVSRLVERKGQAQLIRALPAWRAAVPGAHLLLVGGGPDRASLVALAASLGVADAVTITGSVPAAELPAHYAAGDVFAMACRSRRRGLEVEGLGLVFLEAAACGLPVVVGRSGGSVDALVDGVTGVEVDGGSIDSVREGVLGMLRDRTVAAAMGAAGRAWVTEHFSWDVLAPRLTALLGG
jgi:phosphatidylinositol alpha-1,6-mannosyltransferase